MENFKGLVFDEFKPEDVVLFTSVMKRAFDEDAKIHLGIEAGGPPGYDNGDFLRDWALNKDSHSYKILKDGEPAGCLILWINDDNVNFLGNLFIDSKFQSKGYGITAWEYAEYKYPETVVWRTETPGFSRRNHYFYVNKCGFKIVKIENHKNPEDANYLMEKEMKDKKNV